MEEIDFSKFEKGIFMVNVVGIVYNIKTKKILIGRREKDSYVPELTWGFPGGRISYDKEIEESLKEEIRKKTGISVNIKKLIFARITPEIKRKQVIIYYYCETQQEEALAGEKFIEVKWTKPNECKEYFKTSIHPEIIKFLEGLK